MKIEMNNIERKSLNNFKNGEKSFDVKMFDDSLNKIMNGILTPGASIGYHTHEDSSEIIYILEGNGITIYDGETHSVTKGDIEYCPKGHSHSLINNSDNDLLFIAIVPKQ